MSPFSVTIPGQPPSGGHLYHVVKGYRRGGGSFPILAKTTAAAAYQDAAALVFGAGIPSGWKWDGGMLRISYRMFVTHDVDCDNAIKVINDAIAPKLGVNDKFFLPLVECKHIGVEPKEARVEVTVEPAEHCIH